jgi:hypothetical protein
VTKASAVVRAGPLACGAVLMLGRGGRCPRPGLVCVFALWAVHLCAHYYQCYPHTQDMTCCAAADVQNTRRPRRASWSHGCSQRGREVGEWLRRVLVLAGDGTGRLSDGVWVLVDPHSSELNHRTHHACTQLLTICCCAACLDWAVLLCSVVAPTQRHAAQTAGANEAIFANVHDTSILVGPGQLSQVISVPRAASLSCDVCLSTAVSPWRGACLSCVGVVASRCFHSGRQQPRSSVPSTSSP